MVATRLSTLTLAVALGCGARSDLPCPDASSTSDECAQTERREERSRDDLCSGPLEGPPPCEGAGQIWVSTDECIDDGGMSMQNDLLEVYCVDQVARFCLSHEDCPWRGGGSANGDVTCSTAGLSGRYMANTIGGCAGFQGNELYCCSPEGRIGLAKHSR